MLAAVPISRGEFLQFFQRCMPPGGWSKRIAVANSAGPDSVCLLYLIGDLLATANGSSGLPEELWSFHVNHNLQLANAQMEIQANEIAVAVGATPFSLPIPWGVPPFPPKPTKGEPLEAVARYARGNRLFNAMLRTNVHCIAYGHHADDQVETSIMRLMKGTGDSGAAGMRPVRRWGMGQAGQRSLDTAGVRGMDRWVIRPLLEVPKSRILATCEAHKLEYVTDSTNFQPDLTPRNHIRHYLSARERTTAAVSQGARASQTVTEPKIESAIQALRRDSSQNWSLADLRDAVSQRGYQVSMIESQVSSTLARCRLRSPPSTLLLSAPRLAEVTDPDVQVAVVRRVLRFVSPRPWGSPQAILSGSPSKLKHIADAIWNMPPQTHLGGFSLGARVTWRPMIVRADGGIRLPHHFKGALEEGQSWAWLATRDSPWSASRIINDNEPTAREDWTDKIVSSYKTHTGSVPFLYDARFRIEIDFEQMPRDVVRGAKRTIVSRESPWHLPRVVWEKEGKEITLAHYQWKKWNWSIDSPEMALNATIPWISITSVRILDAI